MTVTATRTKCATIGCKAPVGASVLTWAESPDEPVCDACAVFYGRMEASESYVYGGLEPYTVVEASKPRRMVAVTIAISEPAGSPEINWPFLLSALVRTHFNSYPDVLDHDVIRVIDAWRADA